MYKVISHCRNCDVIAFFPSSYSNTRRGKKEKGLRVLLINTIRDPAEPV